MRYRQVERLFSLHSPAIHPLPYWFRSRRVAIAHWPLWEASGTAAVDIAGGFNGTYMNSPTLGQTGLPHGAGKTAAAFDGVNQRCNVYSAALAAAFDGKEGFASLWFTVDAAAWTDATIRAVLRLRADASNDIQILKKSTDNNISFYYTAAATVNAITITLPSPAVWIHVLAEWSFANNLSRMRLNGSLIKVETSIGEYAGSLAATTAIIAAQGTTDATHCHQGKVAHVMIGDRILTDAEALMLARRSGFRNVLAIGDSKTGGSGDDINHAPAGYPGRLCQSLNLVSNYAWQEVLPRLGVSGISTAGMVDRCDADIAAIASSSTPYTPHEILINLGANDNLTTQELADAWVVNTLYIVDAYHAAFPLANIRLTTIWKRDWSGPMAYQVAGLTVIYAARTWLLPGIDELFLEGGDDGATYTGDGVHPNAAGYALTAAAWQTAIGY